MKERNEVKKKALLFHSQQASSMEGGQLSHASPLCLSWGKPGPSEFVLTWLSVGIEEVAWVSLSLGPIKPDVGDFFLSMSSPLHRRCGEFHRAVLS